MIKVTEVIVILEVIASLLMIVCVKSSLLFYKINKDHFNCLKKLFFIHFHPF